jgi:hypothetical protein
MFEEQSWPDISDVGPSIKTQSVNNVKHIKNCLLEDKYKKKRERIILSAEIRVISTYIWKQVVQMHTVNRVL